MKKICAARTAAVAAIATIAVFFLIACLSESSEKLKPHPEGDFGFILETARCSGRELYDTFSGTFRWEGYCADPVTMAIELSEEQMNTIYQRIREIGFFDLPKLKRVEREELNYVLHDFASYWIVVRNGAFSHTVDFRVAPQADTPKEFQGLVQMANSIREMYYNHGDFDIFKLSECLCE